MSEVMEAEDGTFEETVLRAETPVLVDFSATWCGPCKKLEPIVREIAQEFEGRLRVVRVDVDRARSTAVRFAVLSVPTVVLFQNGEPKDQVTGLVSKKVLAGMVEKVL